MSFYQHYMNTYIKALLFMSCLTSLAVQGQNNTLISYEVGPNDHLANYSTQTEINYYPSKVGVPGIVITQQLFKNFHIESRS